MSITMDCLRASASSQADTETPGDVVVEVGEEEFGFLTGDGGKVFCDRHGWLLNFFILQIAFILRGCRFSECKEERECNKSVNVSGGQGSVARLLQGLLLCRYREASVEDVEHLFYDVNSKS
jgi:hypothetical protein